MLIKAEISDKYLEALKAILSTFAYVLRKKKSHHKYFKSNMQYLNWEMSFLWNHVWGRCEEEMAYSGYLENLPEKHNHTQ